MEDSGITIRYILSRRGGNIEELCDYAKQRGIALTKNDNYVLSEEELKVLDPLLANEIKKKKTSEANLLFSFKQKSDREILNYLFDYWKINETPNQDGSFKVVASYRYEGKDKNGYDYGYFLDIRNLNGDILYYPLRLGPINIYVPHNENYTKEALWLINVKLSTRKKYRDTNPFLLELSDKIFGKPKNSFVDRLKKEKLIRDLFKKRGATVDDAQTIANALNILIGDVRTDSERFLFELLQNADDQPYNDTPVNVIFKTLSEHLLVLHNGNSFSSEDVQVISNIGDKSSHKINNKEKTGYKGIGFKSVFSDSDTVYIDSGGFSFAFDKNSPVYNRVSDINAIPWQIKPIWQERYRLPKEVAEEQFFFSSRVGIALNAGLENITHYNSIIPRLLHDPRFMLFLRHVENINFQSKDVNVMATKKTNDEIVVISNGIVNSDWIVRDYEFEIPDDIKSRIIFEGSNKIPQKLKTATRTKISFAVNYDGNRIEKVEKSLLFTYLPTKVEQFKFPFLINADFIVNSSREYVHDDNIWNKFLFEIIGRKTLDWVKTLSDKEDYLNALPTEMDASDSPLFLTYRAAYKAALESEAFILNHKGELARQDGIIIDETGFSKIVGADLFCQLLQTEKCLPSDNIDSKTLEEDIFEHIETLKFDDVIGPITNNSDFNEWFASATDEQKKSLYKWIDDNDITSRKGDLRSFVANLPLFRFFDTEYSSYRSIISDRDEITPVITTPHILPIRSVLNRLDFQCSDDLFDKNHPLFEHIDLPKEEDLFNSIKNCDFSVLTADERRTLFSSLANFDGVGDAKLKKEIALFKNMNGEFKPLGEMIVNNKEYPIWLNDYIIAKEERSQSLDKYMISDEFVFQEIVQLSFTNLEFTSVGELYDQFKTQWTSTFTKTLIDKYGPTDDLLAIVERTDGAKHYFIEKYGEMHLERTTTRDSVEYKLIQLALSSDYDVSKLKKMIFIDNKNIADYTISPEVSITIDKEYLFPLSEILLNQSDDYVTFNQIKELLSDITGSDALFSLTRMKNSDVRNQLQLEKLSTPTQYAFYVCYNIANNYRYAIPISDEQFVKNVLDYFFDNKIDVLGRYIISFPNQKIIGRFINSDEYTLESERLSYTIRQWADNEEKEKFLIALGAKGNLSDEIKRRKIFLNNDPISLSYSSNITNEIISFLNWCITLETPFTKDNQVKVLKEMFSRLNRKTEYDNNDYQNAKEWDNKRYIEYVQNKISIFHIDGEMPKRGVYNNVHLFTEYVGDYVFLSPNRLYVNVKDKKMETVLLSVSDDRSVPLFTKDDWTKIFMVSVETLNEKETEIIKKDNRISDLEEENRKKDEIIEDLQAKLKEYENDVSGITEGGEEGQPVDQPTPLPNIGRGENPPLTTAEKIAAQIDAQKKLLEIYPNWRYPEGFGKEGSYSYFNVIKENGEIMSIVLKSHRTNAPLHVNTNEWDWIMGKKNDKFPDDDLFQQDYPIAPAKLFIYTGDDIKELDPKYLIENQPSIALSFSTENLNIEDRITAFSDSLHYFNEMTFDFESFNLSNKAKSIKGLYNRNLDEKQNTENNSINDLFD